jgi:hypothetical protein
MVGRRNRVIKQLSDDAGLASDSMTTAQITSAVFRQVYPAHIADDDLRPPTLGELIRRQRELAALPLRQVAVAVGISNAYLSQIERNLSVNPVNVSSGRSPTSWGCRRPS